MSRERILAGVVAGMILVGGCAAPPIQPAGSEGTPPPPTPAVVLTAPAATQAPSPEPAGGGGEVTLRIIPEESEARFLVNEVLAGSPKLVVGTTSAVGGEIIGDYSTPGSVRVGPVTVDLSTLRTDNTFRNRALHEAILQTGDDANRFATFEVATIEGLPDEIEFGTSTAITLTGELTIHGTTRTVTFGGSVTPVSTERLEGTASASMPFADFGIQILRLPPQVASVGDTVTLEIDFVAEPS